jgi:hypothetical protein
MVGVGTQVAQREKRVTGRRQEQRQKLAQLARGRKRERSNDVDDDEDDDDDAAGGGGDGGDVELESEGDAMPLAAVLPGSARDSAREPSPVGRPLQRSRESMTTSSSCPRPSPVWKAPAAIVSNPQ